MHRAGGFTLMELLIAVVILMVALTGLIATYVSCFDLNETMRSYTYVMNAAQRKIEEVREHDYYDIYSYYNEGGAGHTFEIADFYPSGSSPMAVGDSKGVIVVQEAGGPTNDPDVKEVTVSVCWRQRGGRIIGEDNSATGALNGVLDAGEDVNNNGRIDSPVQLTTLIIDR